MTNVSEFPDAETRAQKVREDFNADFKKRWQQRGDCGEFTNDIWAWQDMLEQMGWVVHLYDNVMQESATFVNFDKKLITNRNVKAYHAQKALSMIIDRMFAGATGRWLFYWEEVHDEEHKHVRDGEEWRHDSEYYMTVWYSMELYVREVPDGEDIPLAVPREPFTTHAMLLEEDDSEDSVLELSVDYSTHNPDLDL